MKTIEERARERALKCNEGYTEKTPYDIGLEDGQFHGYYAGATEQRKIDIDKACEVYENELRQMKNILNKVKDGAGELISVGGSLIQFRKAMEE